jgi:hypothetical protein
MAVGSVERLVVEKKVFVESAELAGRVDDRDFEDPKQGRRTKVHGRHGTILVNGVWGLRETMAGEVAVEPPTLVGSLLLGVVVELATRKAVAEPLVAY